MADFDISFGFVVSQEMMTDVYVLGSRVMGLFASLMALSLSHNNGILVK